MSDESKQPTNPTPQREHRTTASYVRGFLLSLIFTLIPYYLVVDHRATGTMLLAIIIGFAVLQMLVQVLFFLHLGREKKPYWQTGFLIATVGEIFVVVVGSLWIMSHLHANMTLLTPEDASKKLIADEGISQIGDEKTGACQEVKTNHQVVIKDGHATPLHTSANVCDTLTFINEDDEARAISFGTPQQQKVYAGQADLAVSKGNGKTITLSEQGTYQFYDHSHQETAGDFKVVP